MRKYSSLIGEALTWFNRNVTRKVAPRLSNLIGQKILNPLEEGFQSAIRGKKPTLKELGSATIPFHPRAFGRLFGHSQRFFGKTFPSALETTTGRVAADIAGGIGGTLGGTAIGGLIGLPFGLGAAGAGIGGVVGGGLGAIGGEGIRAASFGIKHLSDYASNLAGNLNVENILQKRREKLQ